VRDEDGGHAFLLEILEDGEEVVAVVLVERGGRLVEDEELHVAREGLGDLDQLLLADAELLHPGGGIHVESHALEHLGRLLDALVELDETVLRDLVAELDVLEDGHVGHEGELLVDDGNAHLLAVGYVAEFLAAPLDDDLPGVLAVGIHSRKHLHEGRFARPVLADETMYLALADGEGDIAQGFHPREDFGDVLHFQNGCVHGNSLSSKWCHKQYGQRRSSSQV
jgi:hypothetical protein